MAMSPGYGMMPAGDGRLRASTADRERAVDVLKAGFAEGRLTKDEYDDRVALAYSARTYADLSMVTGDLPGGQMVAPYGAPYMPYVPVARRTNGLAVASLVCGLAQPLTAGLTMLPAVILGHVARSQIRRTGEDGKGLATAGLVLGWVGIAFALLVILVVAGAFASQGGGPPGVGPAPGG
jgi:Domain of unknown function (DUF4190)/Domain of unknown function (DUF1707)